MGLHPVTSASVLICATCILSALSYHATLLYISDRPIPGLMVTLFLHVGAEDDSPAWDGHWESQSPKSKKRKKSPPQKSPPQGKGDGKGKGKGKGKSKGKGKDKSRKGQMSQPKTDIRPEDIDIGCSAHKLKTNFTDTYVQFGRSSVSKAALANICGCGPNDKCWAVALSAMRCPICLKLCPCPTKRGHESHDSPQHQFTSTERALCGKLFAP